eukprot:jgi/Hompol1/125/HPOL_005237-RA
MLDLSDPSISAAVFAPQPRALGALRSSHSRSAAAPTPTPTPSAAPAPAPHKLADDKLAIAWRYQSLGQFSSSIAPSSASGLGPSSCLTFDLTKRMPEDMIANAPIKLIEIDSLVSEANSLHQTIYRTLLDRIRAEIVNGGFSLDAGDSERSTSTLRIVLNSLASPAWCDGDYPPTMQDTVLFLHSLKVLLRTSRATAVVTVPSYLYGDFHGVASHPMISRLEHVADSVIELESFAASLLPVNPSYTAEFHGLLHPRRIFGVGLLADASRLSQVQRSSLAFKVRRKRFSIETFHLPPEDAQDHGNANASANANNVGSASHVSATQAKAASAQSLDKHSH